MLCMQCPEIRIRNWWAGTYQLKCKIHVSLHQIHGLDRQWSIIHFSSSLSVCAVLLQVIFSAETISQFFNGPYSKGYRLRKAFV